MRFGTLKRASLALLLVVLACLLPRLRHPVPQVDPVDFHVYYCASLLVHHGDAAQLYTGADHGGDPQKVPAAPDTPIFHAAASQSLSFVGLYLYPPLLADLLVPLTLVDLHTATRIWLATGAACLLLVALLLAKLLHFPVLGWRTGLILLSLVCFTPVLQCMVDGQITIVLLLLWVAGMALYDRGLPWAAGAVFALAAAIKLTPALVVVAFLIWREWRVVLAFLGSLIAFALICLWINTPHTFALYFLRVMPAMSGAIPYVTNFSLPAAVGRLTTLVRTGWVSPFPESLSPASVRVGRLASLIVFAAVVTMLLRTRRTLGRRDRLTVLGLLSLLAPILSPVSWFHAYAMAFVAFVLLWRDVLETEPGPVYLGLLTAASLLLGSAVSENLMPALAYSGRHAVLTSCLQLGQLSAAMAVVFRRLWVMKDTSGGDFRAEARGGAVQTNTLPA